MDKLKLKFWYDPHTETIVFSVLNSIKCKKKKNGTYYCLATSVMSILIQYIISTELRHSHNIIFIETHS